VLTTINTGSIIADSGQGPGSGGISLGPGSTLSGDGTVNGLVTGGLGSKIIGTLGHTLELGKSTSPAGFNYGGELDVGLGETLLDSSGQATLGNLTTLAGGTEPTRFLSIPNGFVLNYGNAITGFGLISSANSSTHPSIIYGILQGTS